ncbi:hypothetical protein [Treponema putidum]|uniref:Sel1 repeat family protein n=2 Tax=Treponema putidum TaxID=221027 RepID=A0ABY5HSY0_9SPIR|nr:hypothetical protein [Treponema putidum]UTY28542.1 sel1 repeat family protein [Treponema putidum]
MKNIKFLILAVMVVFIVSLTACVKDNISTPVEKYTRAAERGDTDAMYILALLYEEGRGGTLKNENAACE